MAEKAAEVLLSGYSEIPLVAAILARLRAELAPSLVYHSWLHTKDVLEETIVFSSADGLSREEQRLLVLAAAYHDTGFLVQRRDNEAVGAELARQAMEAAGCAEQQIKLVERMILDTRLVLGPDGLQQQASCRLSGYLLDADLSNLGRDDFLEKLDLFCREEGVDKDEEARRMLDFMKRHTWFTPAASRLRQSKKEENISSLEQLLR